MQEKKKKSTVMKRKDHKNKAKKKIPRFYGQTEA